MGGSTSAPQYITPQPSAEEIALAQQTTLQNKQATEADARSDTARLMAIYGTRLAMGGVTAGSPLLNAPRGDAPYTPEPFNPQAAGVF